MSGDSFGLADADPQYGYSVVDANAEDVAELSTVIYLDYVPLLSPSDPDLRVRLQMNVFPCAVMPTTDRGRIIRPNEFDQDSGFPIGWRAAQYIQIFSGWEILDLQ